ncbi:MAG: cytochrome b/b6 domain-containing protein [Betaproteobacteria bacterium]|nr:cytochrome b/b6 domain-containing protein [Betaproteobacteria bacterium]
MKRKQQTRAGRSRVRSAVSDVRRPASNAALVPWPMRVYHWTLAGSWTAAWLVEPVWRQPHQWLGYGLAALLAWRLAYGVIGPREWRFASFVVSPRRALRYARQLVRGDAPLSPGYNPLAAWAIVAMMSLLGGVALSGHLLTLERFWGDETLESLHAGLVNSMWLLVGLHLSGVALASLRSRQWLPLAMITGRRRPH